MLCNTSSCLKTWNSYEPGRKQWLKGRPGRRGLVGDSQGRWGAPPCWPAPCVLVSQCWDVSPVTGQHSSTRWQRRQSEGNKIPANNIDIYLYSLSPSRRDTHTDKLCFDILVLLTEWLTLFPFVMKVYSEAKSRGRNPLQKKYTYI